MCRGIYLGTHFFSQPKNNKMKLNEIEVLVHCSSLAKFMNLSFGLTDNEKAKLEEYHQRQNGTYISESGRKLSLTPDMKNHMDKLKEKKANPNIGDTGRSYIRDMISSARFDHYDEATAKEMEHGEMWESHSFDMVNTMIGTDMKKYDGPPLVDNGSNTNPEPLII